MSFFGNFFGKRIIAISAMNEGSYYADIIIWKYTIPKKANIDNYKQAYLDMMKSTDTNDTKRVYITINPYYLDIIKSTDTNDTKRVNRTINSHYQINSQYQINYKVFFIIEKVTGYQRLCKITYLHFVNFTDPDMESYLIYSDDNLEIQDFINKNTATEYTSHDITSKFKDEVNLAIRNKNVYPSESAKKEKEKDRIGKIRRMWGM
jgi:hypothetical protein